MCSIDFCTAKARYSPTRQPGTVELCIVDSLLASCMWRIISTNLTDSDSCLVLKIWQSTIWYAGSLVRWDKWMVNQASDVPSIIFFSWFLEKLFAKMVSIYRGSPTYRKSLTRFPLPRFLAYVSGEISVSRRPQNSPTNTSFM